MDTMVQGQDRAGRPTEAAASWERAGRNAGYVVGSVFLTTTVLFLLDALGVLGSSPAFHQTGAGPLRDEASFWAATFAYQHRIIWDIIARDTLGPVAFIALIFLAIVIRHELADDGPSSQFMVAAFAVGGIISAMASLLFLGNVEFWRITGWSGQPNPVSMVAVGRTSVAIDNLTTWPEAAGYLALAVGLFILARALTRNGAFGRSLRILSYVETGLLAGLALAGVAHADTARNVLSLATGALVAPAFGFLFARHFAQALHERVVR